MSIPLWLQQAVEAYGYGVILLAVAVESMGVPFPGETALLAGAIYAGTTHRLDIALVIVAAAVGAILGDNIGFLIGHYGGYPLVRRLAHLIHMETSTLAYARRYFARHGDKTVFFGRFISILRTWVAFLAGVNRMHWRTFLLWNALGGVTWAVFYGVLGYILGHNLSLLGAVLRALGIGGVVLAAVLMVVLVTLWVMRRRRIRAEWSPRTPAPRDDEMTSAGNPHDNIK